MATTKPIKITRERNIDHNDVDAAGFEDGYRWTVTPPASSWDMNDPITSCSPTREEAIDAALAAGLQFGYTSEDIA